MVLNNGAHDSVGGIATAGLSIDIPGIAAACGYRRVACAHSSDEIIHALDELAQNTTGPSLLEIRVDRGARNDLGRPRTSPRANKQVFMCQFA